MNSTWKYFVPYSDVMFYDEGWLIILKKYNINSLRKTKLMFELRDTIETYIIMMKDGIRATLSKNYDI